MGAVLCVVEVFPFLHNCCADSPLGLSEKVSTPLHKARQPPFLAIALKICRYDSLPSAHCYTMTEPQSNSDSSAKQLKATSADKARKINVSGSIPSLFDCVSIIV
jgi:hypothetical protein